MNSQMWKALLAGTSKRRPELTLFMAVPTIYANLLHEYEAKRHKSGAYLGFSAADIKRRCLNKRSLSSRWLVVGHLIPQRQSCINRALLTILHCRWLSRILTL